MFLKIIFSYMFGYIKILIEGYYIERFINICSNEKIVIWSIKKEKNSSIYLNVRLKDFKRVCKIAKKVKCNIKIKEKRGIPFLINRYKKRKIFLILVIIFIVLLGISSNFIWNIEVVFEDEYEVSNIIEETEEINSILLDLKLSGIETRNVKI